MDVTRAILIGAAIIGAAMTLSSIIAPYRISAIKGADDNPMLFRVNAVTGDVTFCVIAPPALTITCR